LRKRRGARSVPIKHSGVGMRRLVLTVGLGVLVITASAAAETSFERSLRMLAPGERLVQLCDYTAMQRIRKEHGKFRPDRVVADGATDPTFDKNTVIAKAGAFRSRGKWYALSFRCTAEPDNMKVKSFKYRIGAEIPEDKWAADGLW
jgi:hypothetical protein